MLLINKTELARTLIVLSRVAPVRSTTPVLKCARLQTIDRQTVTLTVTNLDEFFTCRIKVSDAPEGLDALLPIPEVRNFIKGNKRALLQIEPLTPGGVIITEFADSKTSKQEFVAPETKDFPVLPPCLETLFSMPPDFIQILNQVTPSISPADTRIALHGILLSKDGIVATNGQELCCIPYDLPVKDNCILRIPDCLFTTEFISLPAKFGTVQNGTHTWATIEVSDWTLTSNCICGTYPIWKHIVPEDKALSFSMTLDKSQTGKFADALKQMTDTAPLHMLQLKTDEDKLKALADCKPAQKAECTLSGVTGQLPEQGIFVNRKLLLRALSLGHQTFACDLKTSRVIVATGGLGKFVFMPIKNVVEVPNNETNSPTNEPETNKMENETMNQETKTNPAAASATTTATAETAKAPVIPEVTNNGFKVVPAPPPTDSYDELLESMDDLRAAIRTINEHAATLTRKIRDQQANAKQREKNMKVAREAIEKLKVSGF
jgi:DNA polymerase III sliding clamp (beta) subunit (PCNA family)